MTFVYLVLTLDLTLKAACEDIPGPYLVAFLVFTDLDRHVSDGISLGHFLSFSLSQSDHHTQYTVPPSAGSPSHAISARRSEFRFTDGFRR